MDTAKDDEMPKEDEPFDDQEKMTDIERKLIDEVQSEPNTPDKNADSTPQKLSDASRTTSASSRSLFRPYILPSLNK